MRLYLACSLFFLALPVGYAALGEDVARFDHSAEFHIAAGSLESALLQFGREAEIQVIISAPVAGMSAPAVEGRLTAREALVALLGGTGLIYIVVGNTVSIRVATTPAEARVVAH